MLFPRSAMSRHEGSVPPEILGFTEITIVVPASR